MIGVNEREHIPGLNGWAKIEGIRSYAIVMKKLPTKLAEKAAWSPEKGKKYEALFKMTEIISKLRSQVIKNEGSLN